MIAVLISSMQKGPMPKRSAPIKVEQIDQPILGYSRNGGSYRRSLMRLALLLVACAAMIGSAQLIKMANARRALLSHQAGCATLSLAAAEMTWTKDGPSRPLQLPLQDFEWFRRHFLSGREVGKPWQEVLFVNSRTAVPGKPRLVIVTANVRFPAPNHRKDSPIWVTIGTATVQFGTIWNDPIVLHHKSSAFFCSPGSSKVSFGTATLSTRDIARWYIPVSTGVDTDTIEFELASDDTIQVNTPALMNGSWE